MGAESRWQAGEAVTLPAKLQADACQGVLGSGCKLPRQLGQPALPLPSSTFHRRRLAGAAHAVGHWRRGHEGAGGASPASAFVGDAACLQLGAGLRHASVTEKWIIVRLLLAWRKAPFISPPPALLRHRVQADQIRNSGIHMVVATPGRLKDMLT